MSDIVQGSESGRMVSTVRKLGDKETPKKNVWLLISTQRGVVLLNVDPAMVPSDLRERPLTEAARAVVRSGDSELVEAIRKVAPRCLAITPDTSSA
jgi:hypothetical protein